ncbi:hypothetical protein DsansV1_C09g0094341 [Dioscorea sansibarensis]
MDIKQEELQVLGIFGIYHQAYNIILLNRHLFAQISTILIIPLALFSASYNYVSNILIYEFNVNTVVFKNDNSTMAKQIAYGIIFRFTFLFLVKFLHFMLILIFSVLPVTAITYTVISTYASQTITFNKIMSFVPKVLKDLLMTFTWYFLAMLIYNIIACISLIVFIFTNLDPQLSIKSSIILIILVIIYVIGFAYMSIIWHLASIISILEGKCGIDAIKTSMMLIKGKVKVAMKITIKFFLLFLGFEISFWMMALNGGFENGWRILFMVTLLVILTMLMLLGFVSFNVLYFVCKAYKHEMVDNSRLFHHLEGYFGEFEHLKTSDVQLEHYLV